MSEHYVVTLDQGHLRIYAERRGMDQYTPGLEEVQAMDFPLGKRSYLASESAPAGRFPGLPGRQPNMSTDERLPMKNEADRRRAQQLTEHVERFLSARPGATWDFAAGAELQRPILERLSTATRQRLRRAVTKDLVRQPPQEVLAQFAD